MTGDHLVQQRGVEHRAGARPALIQRGRAGDQAVARHRAVGGFHADGRGERGGLADRPAGVRADGQWRLKRGQRRGAAAAGSAGHPVDVPRVAGRAVGRVLGGRSHRELVHVRLAQDRDTRRTQPHRDRRVVRRRPASRIFDPQVVGMSVVVKTSLSASGHRPAVTAAPRRRPAPRRPGGRGQRLLLGDVQERRDTGRRSRRSGPGRPG